MVRYLQTIYGIESFRVPDSILEIHYAQNQIIAKFDRSEKQEVVQKDCFTDCFVLKISPFNVVLQHFGRSIVRHTTE